MTGYKVFTESHAVVNYYLTSRVCQAAGHATLSYKYQMLIVADNRIRTEDVIFTTP